jgi:4-hydroxybenzoate polyprenyltransferase
MNKLWYKDFLRWIFFSSIFIAVCAVMLHLFINEASSVYDSAVIFCGTFIAYNLLKMQGARAKYIQANSAQTKWVKSNQAVLFAAIVLLFFAMIFAWFQGALHLKVNWIAAIIFFSVYVLFRLQHKLPKLPPLADAFLKIFNVALVWTLIVTASSSWNAFVFAAVFFLIAALMIPFEIKDVKHDKSYSVATIPLLFSIQKTKWIGYFFLLLSLSFMLTSSFGLLHKVSWLLASIVGALTIWLSNEKRGELYYLALVDAVICLPLLFYTFISRCVL